MTKLLITGGCSNSDPNYAPYQTNHIMTWPKIVSVENGWDLLNVACQGASNNYIENTVYDAVLNNLDKDLIVMVFWTEACRLNLWDIEHFQLTAPKRKHTDLNLKEKYFGKADQEKFSKHFDSLHSFSYAAWLKDRNYLDDKDNEITIDTNAKVSFLLQDLFKRCLHSLAYNDERFYKQDEMMLNNSLRCFKRLKDFLESHNIKYVFKYSLSLINGIPMSYPWWNEDILNLTLKEKTKIYKRHSKILEYCANHSIVKELKIEYETGIVTAQSDVLECGHPNQKGHDKIAELFMEMCSG